ncbi:hypothetical protein ONZ45_g17532 [Pleurotus djamor]|nr:hypothetical protein ONZ45_g17532 [Pleurotus djamor]
MFPTFVSYPSSTPGYLPPYPLRRGYGPAPVVSDTSGLRERYLAAAAEARLAQAQYLAAAAEAETHSSAFYDPYRNVQETYPHPFYTPDRFEHARHPGAYPPSFYGLGAGHIVPHRRGHGHGHDHRVHHPSPHFQPHHSHFAPPANLGAFEEFELPGSVAAEFDQGLVCRPLKAGRASKVSEPSTQQAAFNREHLRCPGALGRIPSDSHGHCDCKVRTKSPAQVDGVDLSDALNSLSALISAARPRQVEVQRPQRTAERRGQQLDLQDILKALSHFQSRESTTPPQDQSSAPSVEFPTEYSPKEKAQSEGNAANERTLDLQDLFKLFVGTPHESGHAACTNSSAPVPPPQPPVFNPLTLLNHLTQPHTTSQSAVSSSKAGQASTSKVPPQTTSQPQSVPEVIIDPLQTLLSSFVGAIPRAPTQAPTPTKPINIQHDTAALKNELTSRLSNEPAGEVRDTIEALLASLVDAAPEQHASPSTDAKGKGKASNTEPTVAPSPTAADIARSLETVYTIETAFSALEGEFVFPTQLDFTPPTSPSSIVAPLPGTETSDSLTRHLSYTSRNQPVRYYEHALGDLLAQLDLIDSFGNEELRSRRKAVVDRVEKALEDLEREVEGRWVSRQAKLAKEQEATSVSPAPVETSSTDADSADVPVVIPDAPATATVTVKSSQPSEPTLLLASEDDPSEAANVSPVSLEPSTTTAPIIIDIDDHVEAIPDDTALPESTDAPSSYPPSSASTAVPSVTSSVDTIRPSDDGGSDAASDTFLLAQSAETPIPKKPLRKAEEGDSTSDWSEVEA